MEHSFTRACVYVCVCTLAHLMMNFHGENWMNHRINLVFRTVGNSITRFFLLEAMPPSADSGWSLCSPVIGWARWAAQQAS